MEINQDETHQIVNDKGEWILKGTLNECENFKANALLSKFMAKTKVKKRKILPNLEEKK